MVPNQPNPQPPPPTRPDPAGTYWCAAGSVVSNINFFTHSLLSEIPGGRAGHTGDSGVRGWKGAPVVFPPNVN